MEKPEDVLRDIYHDKNCDRFKGTNAIPVALYWGVENGLVVDSCVHFLRDADGDIRGCKVTDQEALFTTNAHEYFKPQWRKDLELLKHECIKKGGPILIASILTFLLILFKVYLFVPVVLPYLLWR